MDFLDRKSTPLLIGLLFGSLGVMAGWAAGPSDAEQAQLAARWTARVALPIFLVAYLASSVLRLSPNNVSRAIMRHRRQWGLGFALAHTIHLGALVYYTVNFEPRTFASLIPGGLAYIMIFLMAATSNNASMKALGKNWKRLHTFGIHYIWLTFTLAYAKRIPEPETMVTGLVFTPILLAALGLRLYARAASRRPALA